MKNIIVKNRVYIIFMLVLFLTFSIQLKNFVVSASQYITLSGASSVQEGGSITFNVNFSNSVNNIWLSDGDVIKNGFSGVTKVSKVSNNSYVISISNVTGVGSNKSIAINSGVGYVDGNPTQVVYSNTFSINKKVDNSNNSNNNNSNNNNNNSNNNNNNNNNNNSNNNSNNNNNNNNNNNSNNNNTNNSNNNNNNNSNNSSNSNNTNNNSNSWNNGTLNSNTNSSNTSGNILNAGLPKEDEIKTEDSSESEENNETTNEESSKRPIPNTGKLM